MTWDVHYSREAEMDLYKIYVYIAYTLLSPDTAKRQYKSIVAAVNSLDELPLRHPLFKDEPWRSKGIRRFPVNNYIIYYHADEEAARVIIMRILHKGRDPRQHLQKASMLSDNNAIYE